MKASLDLGIARSRDCDDVERLKAAKYRRYMKGKKGDRSGEVKRTMQGDEVVVIGGKGHKHRGEESDGIEFSRIGKEPG